MLANCYKNCLKLAAANNLKTIAFPSISTGVYAYPIEKASLIALTEIRDFFKNDTSIEKVKIICFENNPYEIYMKHYTAMGIK